jgi:hypothetical protein
MRTDISPAVTRLATPLAVLVLALGLLGLTAGGTRGPGTGATRETRTGLVFRYYAGSGWQFQPLLSFGHLRYIVSYGEAPAANRLVAALVARGEWRARALYWRYDFPYDGHPAPWRSGFVQVEAAEALLHTSWLLNRPALLGPARAALRGLRHGLLMHVGGGLWIREYGFDHQVILNSQLASLLLVHNLARELPSPETTRLERGLFRATVRLLPRFDLGCHSRYQLDGPSADRHYQDYHVGLLSRLGREFPAEPLFRRLYLRWRPCA